MRCPTCDAHNAASATWCGQCYTPFGDHQRAGQDTGHDPGQDPEQGTDRAADGVPREPREPPSSATLEWPDTADDARGTSTPPFLAGVERGLQLPGAVEPAPGTGHPPMADETEDVEPRAEELGDGGFRRTVEGLQWRCRTCEDWNPLEAPTCRVCGAAFGSDPVTDAPAPVPDVALPVVAGASVLAPGAGHVLLERTTEGVTRLVLAVVWALGGVALLRGALASGRSPLPAVPMLLGWAVLVVTCTNDALVVAGVTGTELLRSRALLWLVVAVVGTTAVAALLGVLSVAGG